jgi:hypothetical protein
VLLIFKALAYAVSLGCGFRGGSIFPAIYLGIAVITFPVVWFDISPTVAVAIGAAAGMAAMTGLLLTRMLFAALLVGPAGSRHGSRRGPLRLGRVARDARDLPALGGDEPGRYVTILSSRGVAFSRLAPSSVTATMSSIRTPNRSRR